MSFYLPLTHPEKPDHWRVPVYRDDALYTIKLDIDFTRVFTEQSLPIYIKTKIVIADAGYEPNITRNIHNNLFGLSDVFIYRGSYGLQDTAWRVNDKHYVVVLDKVEMRTLRGEIDGNA